MESLHEKKNPIQIKQISKKKSGDVFFHEISKRNDINRKACDFYIVLTKPNRELIWCEENKRQDAFTHQIYCQIMNRTAWMTRHPFFAIHSWRTILQDNSVLYNTTPNRVGQYSYPRRYYLRIMDNNESTHHSRNSILQECVTVRVYHINLCF